MLRIWLCCVTSIRLQHGGDNYHVYNDNIYDHVNDNDKRGNDNNKRGHNDINDRYAYDNHRRPIKRRRDKQLP